jgi:sec-independent protein translocase protein TatB
VRGQLHETLGDDFDHLRDMDLRQYNPKTFIRDQLLADDDAPVRRGSATGSSGVAASTAAGRVRPSQMTRPRDAATPPPFDPDAT